MTEKDLYKVAYIAKTHGLRGEVTIMPMPECPDLSEVSTLFVETRNGIVPYFVETISIRPDKAFVKFEDVETPEQGLALKGCSLFLPKADRPKLKRGEFYNDEVIGFRVSDGTLGLLGTVETVEEAGPNRFLVLQANGKEVMIPVNGPFIQHVNKSRKEITVALPEGFLEI